MLLSVLFGSARRVRPALRHASCKSSELIDSPLASKLGLYRALLFLEEQGTVEKFRPYSMPGAEWYAEVKKQLGV